MTVFNAQAVVLAKSTSSQEMKDVLTSKNVHSYAQFSPSTDPSTSLSLILHAGTVNPSTRLATILTVERTGNTAPVKVSISGPTIAMKSSDAQAYALEKNSTVPKCSLHKIMFGEPVVNSMVLGRLVGIGKASHRLKKYATTMLDIQLLTACNVMGVAQVKNSLSQKLNMDAPCTCVWETAVLHLPYYVPAAVQETNSKSLTVSMDALRSCVHVTLFKIAVSSVPSL